MALVDLNSTRIAMAVRRGLCVYSVIVSLTAAVLPAESKEFDLSGASDKFTLLFTPKSAGKVVMTGKWDGKAKSLEWILQSPTQWLPIGRGNIVNKSFELSWDFSQKDVDEAPRPWKIIVKAKGGDAKGDVDVAGTAIDGASADASSAGDAAAAPDSQKSAFPRDEDGMIKPAAKEELPPIPLDEFGTRVKRTFLESPYYKPWLDKVVSGKKSPRIDVRPIGLTVTPAIRKIQSRYGALSLTVRNITLTPAQNVHLMESITGSVETKIEVLMRVEVPGWHLIAMRLAPYAAYPGEPPRMTEMQVEVRSLSRGEIIPASSYPIVAAESILLVPVLLSQPGEYLFTGRPIAKEPSEILFVLGGIEIYRVSS